MIGKWCVCFAVFRVTSNACLLLRTLQVIPGVMDVWQSWMRLANVVAILNKYTWTTNGAVFRNTPITTTFDYTRSDPEWGFSQASFLVKELETALAAKNLPVDVKHTKSTVQLLPRGVDKGAGRLLFLFFFVKLNKCTHANNSRGASVEIVE